MTTYVLTFEAEGFADVHQEIETDSDQAAITAGEKIASEMGNKWQLGLVNKKRGGKRLGAGRKPGYGKYGVATKTVRVPVELAPKIPQIFEQHEQIKEVIALWQEQITPKREGTPRWKYVQKLLGELQEVLSDESQQ